MGDQLSIDEFSEPTEDTADRKMVRLKHLAQINPTKSELDDLDSKTDVSFIPLNSFGTDGEIKQKQTRTLEEVYDGYTYFQEGDIAIAKITPSFENRKGAICRDLKNGIGFGTTELHILRPGDMLSTRYLWYILRGKKFRSEAIASMHGVAGQQRIPRDMVENFKIQLIPKDKQIEVADYLDMEVKKINTLIENLNELSDLMSQRDTAVITRNVSSLSPPHINGEFESALDENVQSVKLGYCCDSIVDAVNETAPTTKDGYGYMIRTSQIRNGKLDLDNADMVDKEVFEEWNRRAVPEPGDIIFTREAPVGEACIVPENKKVILGQRMMLIRPDEAILNPQYLLYWLYSKPAKYQYNLFTHGSTVKHLRVKDVPNLELELPPIDIQNRIVDEISQLRARTEKLTEKVGKMTTLLEEKRQAVITAAVTGQIDMSAE
ncbi:restriction endonuclease subunit S [Halorubrum saccharovorum]|uniref:restriction endonuclease subunit S n=1 Tax=Halorubrum saccharovorum TaxID=2248 RepID=UPI0009B5AE49|nr:restriction endonuclease subunit S [Halorubrum saccharovorum]